MRRFAPVAQCDPGSPLSAARSFDRLPQHRRHSTCTVSRLPRPARQSVRSESPRRHSRQTRACSTTRTSSVSSTAGFIVELQLHRRSATVCPTPQSSWIPRPGIPSPVASCQPVGCHSPLNRMSHASSRTSRDVSSPLLGNEGDFFGPPPLHRSAGSEDGPPQRSSGDKRGAAQLSTDNNDGSHARFAAPTQTAGGVGRSENLG